MFFRVLSLMTLFASLTQADSRNNVDCLERDMEVTLRSGDRPIILPRSLVMAGAVLDYVNVRARGEDEDAKIHIDLNGEDIGYNRIGQSDSSEWNKVDVQNNYIYRGDQISMRAKDTGNGRIYVYKVETCYRSRR